MGVEGKRVAMLVADLYQELEFWYPYYRLKEVGAEVTAIGSEAGKVYTSKNGYPAKADRAASEVSADQFDAVVIPGGYAPDLMRRDEHMVRFVREMYERGKLVAAICHAGWMPRLSGNFKGQAGDELLLHPR
jgi:protease I